MSSAPRRGDELVVDVDLRHTGKTTRLVEWVLEGVRAEGYPGWSRVLVVHSINEVLLLRKLHPKLTAQQLYHLADWQKAHGVNPSTEVALDFGELYLWEQLHRRGVLTRVALSGRSPEGDAADPAAGCQHEVDP